MKEAEHLVETLNDHDLKILYSAIYTGISNREAMEEYMANTLPIVDEIELDFLRKGDTIRAIQHYRKRTGCLLRHAKAICDYHAEAIK